jgi:hypothetical protein
MVPFPNGDDEVRYPGVIIEDVPLRAFTGWEGNRATIDIQSLLEIGYFVSEPESGQHVLFFSPLNGGGKALGNVKDSSWIVLVELHHRLSRARGDGSHRGHKGPYGGRRANGHLDHSIDGDGGHLSQSVGVVVRAGVVFAEPGVDKGMVRGLVVDPQKEELLWLEVGLELEGDDFEWDSAGREGLEFGCDHLGEGAHLALPVIHKVFIDN